jgi:hypothetical protein
LLIFDYVVGRAFAVSVTAVLSALFVGLWIVLPLWRRHVYAR